VRELNRAGACRKTVDSGAEAVTYPYFYPYSRHVEAITHGLPYFKPTVSGSNGGGPISPLHQ